MRARAGGVCGPQFCMTLGTYVTPNSMRDKCHGRVCRIIGSATRLLVGITSKTIRVNDSRKPTQNYAFDQIDNKLLHDSGQTRY